MTVLPMTTEHVAAVAALEARAFSTPWSENSIRSELDNPWAIWYVALEGEDLLGYIGVQYGPDGGDIMTVATQPQCQGRGIAKTLIGKITEIFLEKSLEYLTLEVRPSNSPALGLYSALGFREVGRRKNYYRQPTEDALLLTLYFKEESTPC